MLIISWVEFQGAIEKKILISTPVGNLAIYEMANSIIKTEWVFESQTAVPIDSDHCRKIQCYLKNPSTALTINLQKQGSLYRNKVWSEICKIPLGEVKSYSQIAKAIGSGARAVANACRNNPFPGIIPCHRVVSVSGLGGYMGETSGKCIEIKKKLLELELSIKGV